MRKRKPEVYTGSTRAYSRYLDHHWRTGALLKVGLLGLGQEVDIWQTMYKKVRHIKAPRGPIPKTYQPQYREEKADDSGGVTLIMDPRTGAGHRKLIEEALTDYKKLRFHHFSILAVSIWAGFETYISMLFMELFEKVPAMLKTSNTITFHEAIDHQDDLQAYVIDKILEQIGHFTLKEMFSYLKSRINFSFTPKREKDLEEYYLIRNIISHSSGQIRPTQRQIVPKVLAVVDNEIRIKKSYLEKMQMGIISAITSIERHVEQKFF